jgi:hypothetical protein
LDGIFITVPDHRPPGTGDFRRLLRSNMEKSPEGHQGLLFSRYFWWSLEFCSGKTPSLDTVCYEPALFWVIDSLLSLGKKKEAEHDTEQG